MQVEELAITELETVRSDLARARNRLGVAVILFALMHVLIIGPYIQNQGELERLEVERGEVSELADMARSQASSIEDMSRFASSQTRRLLGDRTAALVADFEALAETISRAADVDSFALRRPAAQPQLQLQQLQVPPVQRAPGPMKTPPDELIRDFVESAPGARDAMMDWARQELVLPAYRSIQEEWETTVRRELLDKLDDAITDARAMAAQADALDPAWSQALNETADALANWRERITELDLAPDAEAALPVDADFWKTVAGKEDYAALVERDLQARLSNLILFANQMPDTLRDAANAQDALTAKLDKKQKELSQQFDTQKGHVESLIGGWAVLPMGLPEFVAFFPLSMGLVFGFLLWQGAVLRRNAADTLESLAVVWNEDRKSLRWLAARLQKRPQEEMVSILCLSTSTAIWIVLAQVHIATGDFNPIGEVQWANLIPAIPVVLAAAFDWASIRRLTAAILRTASADQ